MPRVGSPLWLYMTVVLTSGAAALAFAVADLQGFATLLRHQLFWVIMIMIVGGEIWPIALPGRPRSLAPAASITIGFATLLGWGFGVAIVLRTAGAAVAALGQRSAGQRPAVQSAALRAAQEAVSLTVAGVVLASFGVHPQPTDPWRSPAGQLPIVLLAAVAYFVVGFTLAAIAAALRSRTSVLAVARARLRNQGFAYLVMLAAAPLVTLVIATKSAVMAALLAFPLAAVYISAAMSAQREHQAHHDELTGLANRKLLVKRCCDELATAAAAGTRAGFLLLDLDRFKEVNDALGHPVGDRLLQIVADRLAHSVRPGDVVARLGGDEFAVLLPAVREPAVAREVASRLRAALGEPVRLEAMTFDIQASVGIAMYPEDADGFEQLLQRADVAMYLAKERRSGIERYQAEADRNSPDRLAMAGELCGAVHRGEIELHFQPKVRLSDGAVIGMEALARWPHPRRGMLAAAEFVGLAEQSHLMNELTELVIDKALAQAADWVKAGHGVQVCVNLPVRDLIGGRLTEVVGRALSRYQLPAQALRLEVSELVLATKTEQAAATLRQLADLGVGLSLDDFGTGYTSLAQLTRLGISEVKLDPALIRGLTDFGDESRTVKSLVQLAQSLGICSIGEGVETAGTAALLRLLGCDGAQGWHFGRPLTAATAGEWLAEHVGGREPDVLLASGIGRPWNRSVLIAPPVGQSQTVQASALHESALQESAVPDGPLRPVPDGELAGTGGSLTRGRTWRPLS